MEVIRSSCKGRFQLRRCKQPRTAWPAADNILRRYGILSKERKEGPLKVISSPAISSGRPMLELQSLAN